MSLHCTNIDHDCGAVSNMRRPFFIDVFSRAENGLSIYNALLGTDYKDTSDFSPNPISIKSISYRDILMMMDPPFNGLKEEYVINHVCL